jgi:hypothetical protein
MGARLLDIGLRERAFERLHHHPIAVTLLRHRPPSRSAPDSGTLSPALPSAPARTQQAFRTADAAVTQVHHTDVVAKGDLIFAHPGALAPEPLSTLEFTIGKRATLRKSVRLSLIGWRRFISRKRPR